VRLLIRLIVIPSIAAAAVYFLLIVVLRLDLPPYDQPAALFFLLGIPFVGTFFSQLHRMDVLYRIKRLERHVEQLQLESSGSRGLR
jgi:hypothetical protein